jgi:putative ubiquitin-RnfH superfamily antitoxin RatB of RatAB toxin-antitoxin module
MHQQKLISLKVKSVCSVLEVIELSSIQDVYPEINLERTKLVFLEKY